jgi:hypothetical protein
MNESLLDKFCLWDSIYARTHPPVGKTKKLAECFEAPPFKKRMDSSSMKSVAFVGHMFSVKKLTNLTSNFT